jgi:hypothetical protein
MRPLLGAPATRTNNVSEKIETIAWRKWHALVTSAWQVLHIFCWSDNLDLSFLSRSLKELASMSPLQHKFASYNSVNFVAIPKRSIADENSKLMNPRV